MHVILIAALVMAFIIFLLFCFKWPKISILLLVVYILSYLPFTLAGQYVVANHGGNDWSKEWVPKHLMIEYMGFSGRMKTDLTFLGVAYLPCIMIDRLSWHHTMKIN